VERARLSRLLRGPTRVRCDTAAHCRALRSGRRGCVATRRGVRDDRTVSPRRASNSGAACGPVPGRFGRPTRRAAPSRGQGAVRLRPVLLLDRSSRAVAPVRSNRSRNRSRKTSRPMTPIRAASLTVRNRGYALWARVRRRRTVLAVLRYGMVTDADGTAASTHSGVRLPSASVGNARRSVSEHSAKPRCPRSSDVRGSLRYATAVPTPHRCAHGCETCSHTRAPRRASPLA
jgi:hypothetical protein